MTVAVSCNLSEGVVLAVDSAVTVPAPGGGVAKVFENAEKLFQLGERPIGVALYGLGSVGERNVGSFIQEFEQRDPDGAVSEAKNLRVVVEGLRKFFMAAYRRTVVPALQQETGKKFRDIDPQQIPTLGLVVGGFSERAYLSEVWEIRIPQHSRSGTAIRLRAQGEFGTNWFAMYEPILRYIKGYDEPLMEELAGYLFGKLGRPPSKTEQEEIGAILGGREYQMPYGAMPMAEGIEHARFLAELVVGHHRFAMGAPVVGGRVSVGHVTYRGGRFRIKGLDT